MTFSGLVEEGPGQVAELTIGLRVGKPRRGSLLRRCGAVIEPQVATDEILKLRTRQVGGRAASATITRCEGRWLGGPGEPTLVCQIEHVPSPRERLRITFERHMQALAERTALRFGQQEVWLRMGGKLYRANAPGEPAPKMLRPGGRVIR